MTTPILTKPVFVDTLPAAQRASLAPRKSELKDAAKAFVELLKPAREQWAKANTEPMHSTSSIYEAFREAGCEVRVVRLLDQKTGQPRVVNLKDSSGNPKDYPLCDIFVKLPEGEIKSRSGRKPWVSPAKRRDELVARLSDRNLKTDERAAAQVELDALKAKHPTLFETT